MIYTPLILSKKLLFNKVTFIFTFIFLVAPFVPAPDQSDGYIKRKLFGGFHYIAETIRGTAGNMAEASLEYFDITSIKEALKKNIEKEEERKRKE